METDEQNPPESFCPREKIGLVNTGDSRLRRFIRANPLCALVSMSGRGLVASHIPVVLHETGSGFGVLRGHLARGNPQWRDFNSDVETLAIFTGPQHFISASWYPGKKLMAAKCPPGTTSRYTLMDACGWLKMRAGCWIT